MKFQIPSDSSSKFKYLIAALLWLLENIFILISQGYGWGYDV